MVRSVGDNLELSLALKLTGTLWEPLTREIWYLQGDSVMTDLNCRTPPLVSQGIAGCGNKASHNWCRKYEYEYEFEYGVGSCEYGSCGNVEEAPGRKTVFPAHT